MARPSIDFPKRKTSISPALMKEMVSIALREDLGDRGDLTTQALLAGNRKLVTARIIAKEDGVVCGLDVLSYVYQCVDDTLNVELLFKDGDSVRKGDRLVNLKGLAGSITSGERVALNFLGLMSGVATKARHLQAKLTGTAMKLLDTRKTLPGLREFQKYAVQCGGASNHRIGLYDMILIKENHIAAAGGVTRAVELAKNFDPAVVVEIETETLEQVREAKATAADVVMLDNMDNATVAEALKILDGTKYVEASGNMTEDRLLELARLGVDYVSMGSLTHTVKPLDVSLLIDR